MPTSIVDSLFDLINITRTGTLADETDTGTNFSLNINGSLSPSWAGSIATQFKFLGILSGTYILASDVDWDSLLVEIPDSAKILNLELRCNAAIDCTSQITDVADLHNNVISGTCRQNITFSVEAPNAGAYTLTTDSDYVQDISTVSGVVSTYNISKILNNPAILLDKIWDFTVESLGYISKDDLVAAFTHTQIKLVNWFVLAQASIFSNSHTGNSSLTASLQSSLWQMIIEWEESWTITSVLPDPAAAGDTVTITGTGLQNIPLSPNPTIQYTDDHGDTQTVTVPDATLVDNEHITFTLPPPIGPPSAQPPFYPPTVTVFSGTVPITILNVYVASGTGIYRIVKDKTNDTLYDYATGSTIDVKIPDPFFETGFIGG